MASNHLTFVQQLLPDITFVADSTFYWSPKDRTVYFNSESLSSEHGRQALLHEAAHALLDHRNYQSDFELLMLEIAAWEQAKVFATDLNDQIDQDHIEDCLDTYRDWLHQRSTCPTCGVVSTQESSKAYRCFNCNSAWRVSTSRFCRPYRALHGTITS